MCEECDGVEEGKHYFHSLKNAPPKTTVPLFMTMKHEGIFKINHRMSHVC